MIAAKQALNKFSQTQTLSSLQHQLIEGLNQIPPAWVLTPVNGNKQPYRKNWQRENPLSHKAIAANIKSGEAKGYGLRTGTISGGILAIDADGHAAHEKILELSGGEPLPETVAFTSDKPGRCQYLFVVPEKYRGAIATKKISTGVKGDDGKEQKLELRWDGCQSVLPPSVHPETDFYRWRKSPEEVELAPAPMWVIEMMLKDCGETEAPLLNRHPEAYENWSDIEWALSYLNALSPSRADDYEDWLAVGMALHSLNEDSLLLEWDDWSKMSPKYKVGECEKKWRSFKRQGLAIGSLAHMAKQDGWTSPFKSSGRGYGGGIGSGGTGGSGGSGGDGGDGGDGGGNGGNSKVVNFPGFEPLTIEQVTEKIDELIATGATGSYLTGQLNRLAAVSQYYVGELRKLYYERLGESDLEGDRDSNRTEIENLLNLTDQSLELADYLPQSLAQPITQWCNWLNIRPAVALTALLAGISSVHKTGTELVLQRNQNFRVPSTIYAALVSPSGQKKSPLFNNVIRRSLNTLEKEKLTVYEAAMEDYETALQQWEETKEGKKPQKPKDPSIYYFTNATGEAIPVQAGKDPSKTLLALIDELAGYFNSNNAYRNGRGSDKQDLLSYFDGSGQTILRAGGVRVNLKSIYLSIFGTIQPEVLKRHMQDCSDPDGNWARFLFVNQPLQAATLHDDDGLAIQICDRLTDFYRRIDQLPEMEYRLSPQAFKRYQQVYNQLERLRVTHPQSGMAAVYSKMEGYIGRLALNLHVLWELDANKECPDEEIPFFIMEMAIQLAKFYIGQVKLIHANADDESLPTHIVKMLELSKRLEKYTKNGWIKAKAIQDMYTGKKRPTAQVARDWMIEAVGLGFGQTRGKGNRLEYHWQGDNNCSPDDSPSPSNLGNLGKSLGTIEEEVPKVETPINQDFQENLRNLRKDSPTANFVVEEQNLTEDMPPPMESPPPEIALEGGSDPKPSPTLPQECCEAEPVGITELENNLRNPSPTFPQVPQVCDSSAQAVTTPTLDQNQLSERVDEGENDSEAIGASDILEQDIALPSVGYWFVDPSAPLKKVFAPVADPEARYTIFYLDGDECENCLFIGSPAPDVFYFFEGEEEQICTLRPISPEEFEDRTLLYLQTQASGENTTVPVKKRDLKIHKALIERTDWKMKELRWTPQQGKEFLLRKYGVRSRHLLTNDKLLDFLNYLQSQ